MKGTVMGAKLLPLALCTGLGLGFLLLAVRQLVSRGTAVGAWSARDGRRDPAGRGDRRRTGLVVFTDHLGRTLVFDPGAYGPLRGLPPVGGTRARGLPARTGPRRPGCGRRAVSAVAGVRVVPVVDRGLRAAGPMVRGEGARGGPFRAGPGRRCAARVRPVRHPARQRPADGGSLHGVRGWSPRFRRRPGRRLGGDRDHHRLPAVLLPLRLQLRPPGALRPGSGRAPHHAISGVPQDCSASVSSTPCCSTPATS